VFFVPKIYINIPALGRPMLGKKIVSAVTAKEARLHVDFLVLRAESTPSAGIINNRMQSGHSSLMENLLSWRESEEPVSRGVWRLELLSVAPGVIARRLVA
jgi:hypothetical protein